MSRRKIGIILSGILLLGLLFFLISKGDSHTQAFHHFHHPLAGRTIVLDAGHGGPDGGAEGGSIQEKDVTLAITKRIRDYLQEAGAYVVLTRTKDEDLASEDTKGLSRRKTEDLKARAKVMDKADPDCFVSIHLNAIPSSRWRGAQTFYHPKDKQNMILARFIQQSITNELQNTDRMAKTIQHVYLLRRAQAPAALVEVGFLSNPSERQLLETEEYQQKVAESIYQGIMRYFTKEKPPAS